MPIHFRPLEILNNSYAVLVLNVEIKFKDKELLQKIWNNAKIRGLVDGGANRFIELYKSNDKLACPTFVSGDFDSALPETLEFFKLEKSTEIIETPDQNFTDFNKALDLVLEKSKQMNIELDRILVLYQHTGRLDQTMGNLHTLLKYESCPTQIYFFNEDELTFNIPSGESELFFNKHFFEGENNNYCGIIPLTGKCKIKSSGLKWDLDGIYGFDSDLILSTSNEILTEKVVINTEKNLIITISKEPLLNQFI